MSDMFGQYRSQESRALQSIDSSKYPDTNQDLEATLSRTVEFVDYISQYLQVMQKGVDQANMDIITRTRDIFTNLAILIGGGSIGDIDFGDIQYFFPVIGALFGFDADTPFPINLFHAAERFFLGYVVPLDSFAFTISDMIIGFMNTIGLSEDFIDAWREVFDELIELGSSFGAVFGALWDLLDIFGLGGDGSGFGIFADIWHVVTSLFGGLSFDDLLGFADPVFDLLAPWVKVVARLVDWFSQVVKGFAGGIENLDGILNFAGLFGIIDFLDEAFGVEWAWRKIVEGIMLPFNLLIGPSSPFNARNIFGLLDDLNIPFIPLSHLSNQVHPNLLVQPNFSMQDSIEISGPGWEWDGTTGRGSNTGCAHATGGSIERMLRSIKVKVASDQAITCKVWAKWNSIFYTGTSPIAMDLVRYIDNVEVGRTTLSSFVSPATNQPAWIQLVSSEYDIPDDGTNYVELQLRVRETMSSGDVWFDDAELRKTKDTIPQGWVQNLLDDLGGLGQFIQDVIDAIISAIRGIPFIGGNIAALISWVTGWKDDTEAAASVADDAYIGLNVTQQIMIAATTGTTLEPGTVTLPQDIEVQSALEAQTQVIVQQNAFIEQINAQVTQTVTSGVRVVDPVEEEFHDELNPALWQEFTLEGGTEDAWMESADGQTITMGWGPGSPSSTKMYRYIGEGEHTLTNRQRVTASIARGLKYAGLDGRRPHHAAYCRVSDDGTKWVRAYVTNKSSLIVDYRNGASSGVLFNSGEDWKVGPGPGSSLGIEPGFGTNDRMFRVFYGNTPVKLVEDLAAVTDINEKGHGIGMRVASGFGPGAFSQYAAIDNTPAPVPGTHLHVARLTTGSTSIAEGAYINVFSSTAVKQNGIDWDGTVATIKTSDTYVITLRIKHSSYISNSNQDACVLGIEVDGILQPLGPSLANGIGGLVGSTPYIMRINALHSVWTIPLNAGQVVRPLLYSNNNASFPCVGDANGILSYMTITRT